MAEQYPIADVGPDVYGNAFSSETSGRIKLTAAKVYDPDGGECACERLLADTTLAVGCSTSVMLDTGRYVIVLRITDNEKHWTEDTLNATISRYGWYFNRFRDNSIGGSDADNS